PPARLPAPRRSRRRPPMTAPTRLRCTPSISTRRRPTTTWSSSGTRSSSKRSGPCRPAPPRSPGPSTSSTPPSSTPGRPTTPSNGYRVREWDTRAGTVELAIPKLRSGSYFPDWLLQHRRRAEQALVSVVATSYLLGVSTRRVEKLVEQLGVAQLSKSQVSEMARHLDAPVEAFRNRPLDAGHYTFVWMGARVNKVREHGRTVNVHALIPVGVNADGGREVLGLDIASDEDGAGWLAFLRSLTARGLSGVRLVISDAHRGLVGAIGAALPGASWQRCRTHYLRNLLAKVPKSAQPWVATLVRTDRKST